MRNRRKSIATLAWGTSLVSGGGRALAAPFGVRLVAFTLRLPLVALALDFPPVHGDADVTHGDADVSPSVHDDAQELGREGGLVLVRVVEDGPVDRYAQAKGPGRDTIVGVLPC